MATMPLGPSHEAPEPQTQTQPQIHDPLKLVSRRPSAMDSDKEMSFGVIEGNDAVTGQIISTTIGGKNCEPKQI